MITSTVTDQPSLYTPPAIPTHLTNTPPLTPPPRRISPPGEFCTKSFGEPITRHEFPEATAMPSAPPSATQKTFKITVESIARRDDMPVVDCAMCERLSLSPSTSPITPPATPPSTPLSASPPRLSNFIPPPLVKAPPPAPIVRIPASSPASSSSMTRGAAAVSRYLGGLSRPLTSTSLTTPDRHGSLGAGLKLTPPSSTLVASPNSLFTPLTSGSACHLTPKSLTPLPDERRRPLDPSINQISQFTCPVKRSRLNNNNDCTEIDDLSRMEIAETSGLLMSSRSTLTLPSLYPPSTFTISSLYLHSILPLPSLSLYPPLLFLLIRISINLPLIPPSSLIISYMPTNSY